MASYVVPSVYAAFVWWFSTGAVLLLIGLSARFDALRVVCAAGLLAASLFGLALTANDVSIGGAYVAFTCTILLWGAQEITFLAGWLTGPRPEPCPAGAAGFRRLGLALLAILYHELALLACAAAIVALTWNGSNPVGLWTFAALWVLRQSAKINLFLGVPVTNDELMPDAVRFLKTFFVRKPVGAFFPVSVTLATAILVIMIQRIVEVSVTPFEVVGLTLVSALFALGVVEHWFMLLPLPAMKLWGWGMRPGFQMEDKVMTSDPFAKPVAEQSLHDAATDVFETSSSAQEGVCPQPATLPRVRNDRAPEVRQVSAKQRLEDEFRQRFLEQHGKRDLATALNIVAEPAVTFNNGRTS